MTHEELIRIVFDALAEIAPEAEASEIETDVELREQLEIDSMDLLNLAIGLHERTGIDIPEKDQAGLATIDDLVAYLAARLP